MKYKTTVKTKERSEMQPCVHGSTYCFCKHNLWTAMQLPGHPTYPSSKGGKKTGKKGKQRKRGGGIKTLIERLG